jgi:hypothetical protein
VPAYPLEPPLAERACFSQVRRLWEEARGRQPNKRPANNVVANKRPANKPANPPTSGPSGCAAGSAPPARRRGAAREHGGVAGRLARRPPRGVRAPGGAGSAEGKIEQSDVSLVELRLY